MRVLSAVGTGIDSVDGPGRRRGIDVLGVVICGVGRGLLEDGGGGVNESVGGWAGDSGGEAGCGVQGAAGYGLHDGFLGCGGGV